MFRKKGKGKKMWVSWNKHVYTRCPVNFYNLNWNSSINKNLDCHKSTHDHPLPINVISTSIDNIQYFIVAANVSDGGDS